MASHPPSTTSLPASEQAPTAPTTPQRGDAHRFHPPPAAVPPPLQPAAGLLLSLWGAASAAARALWPLGRGLALLAYRLAVYTSPLLVWAALKYVRWTFLGWLDKAERLLRWADWLLGLLPAAKGSA